MERIVQTWWFTVKCPKKGEHFVRVDALVNCDMSPRKVTEAVKDHVRQYVKQGRPCEHCKRRHRPTDLRRG